MRSASPGGWGVLVSRGELVEIGGGVRIPEIVRRAGARLIEVGTTNRTRVTDFEEPLLAGRAGLVLRVHRSNFAMTGFVESPDPAALAALAREHGAIVVDDLGSGALLDTARFGLPHEPTPAERLAAGADLVTFSGDKLVGGPQAGLVVGRADLVARLRRDPLARAMRPDKATLAAVAATLGLYRAGRAGVEIPVWRQLAATPESLVARADALAARLGASAIRTEATVGGGCLPGATLPSAGVAIEGWTPDLLARALRAGDPGVLGRVENGRRCSTSGPWNLATTTSSRPRSSRPGTRPRPARPGTRPRLELAARPGTRSRAADEHRRRDCRAHRPRQDDAAPGADRASTRTACPRSDGGA